MPGNFLYLNNLIKSINSFNNIADEAKFHNIDLLEFNNDDLQDKIDELTTSVNNISDRIKTAIQENGDKYKFYEIIFGKYGNLTYVDSVCIKATRKPNCNEAEKFCKKYMKKNKYDYVWMIKRISRVEAEYYFDLSDEENWPAFGLEE